jgi:Holliday junction resolvasome RuvABC endonuclease subunit
MSTRVPYHVKGKGASTAMARKKVKNPKARKAAAKRLLAMSMHKKELAKEAVAGNGTADRKQVPEDYKQQDPGNPGTSMS